MNFAFGKNWASYSALIGDREIAAAERALLKLIPVDQLRGRSFLDIGCGSGLHTLAAIKLGAGPVTAIDIDPDSTATTRAVLDRLGAAATVRKVSVFDLTGTFDIVYSWGVLHHTGDMWRAVEKAASLVAPGGLLAVALYRSTKSDAFWVREKRWYAGAPAWAQSIARTVYRTAFRFACRRVTGKSYRVFVENYKKRGMDHNHDIHDWLGGYPYETALAPDVDCKLTGLGLSKERVFAYPRLGRAPFGSVCDEYVYRRG